MCSTCSDSVLSSSAHALNIDIVLERVVSYLDQDKENPNDVIKYRLLNHKWNDTIVRIVKKSKQSFRIRLRYGSHVPRRLVKSDAHRWSKELLENITSMSSGTVKSLQFDTVVIDRDFYLAGVMPEWKQYLEIYGESIRQLKFKIRSTERRKSLDYHVTDCEEVVSKENVRAAFLATPNLESLDLSIRFINNSEPICPLPQFKKLTSIKILEPEGVNYSVEFIKEILAMASNLTSLYMKPSGHFYTFADATETLEPKLKRSLTSLSIDSAHFDCNNFSFHVRDSFAFTYLNLTTLQLNDIFGDRKYLWTALMIQSHHSTLKKLILGDEKNIDPHLNDSGWHESILPSIMDNLKVLEVNLAKFKLSAEDVTPSYGIKFPVLESLVFKGYGGRRHDGNEWTYEHLNHLLPGDHGKSLTVKEFVLRGQIYNNIDDKLLIVSDVSSTFPCAVQYFDE